MDDATVDLIIRMSFTVAHRYQKLCKTRADYEDLVSIARIGGLRALDKHDPEKSSLPHYMFLRMESEIRHYIRSGQLTGIKLKRNSGEIVFAVAPRDYIEESNGYTQDLPRYLDLVEFRKTLSPREVQVIERMDQGKSFNEIGRELGISGQYVGRVAHKIGEKLYAFENYRRAA